jgi:hypothetical protein
MAAAHPAGGAGERAGAGERRRTASAFPRFKAAHGYDAFVLSLRSAPKIAARPEVASVTPLGAIGNGGPTCTCPRPINDSGRLQQTDDEVALGATTMRQVGAHIGSLVRVTVPGPGGRARTLTDQVVGTTGFAPNVGTAGLGTGAALTLGGLLGDHCDPGPAGTACQVRAATRAGTALVIVVPRPG